MANEPQEAAWLHVQRSVSIVELAEAAGVPETLVRELVEYGALVPADPQSGEWSFSAAYVMRVRKAARVCGDLELETPAMALAISYLERIETLEEEVRRLRAQIARPRG
jgi:chaperone modulatory protein CbpM